MSEKETIIISLGGSLVAPNEIDIGFLKNFKHSLSRYARSGEARQKYRFFIIVGGGKIARNYQKALAEFGANNTNKDWIGINATRLNAEVVKQLFSANSFEKVITDPTKKVKTSKNIIVGAGWKPGWSTDYCAVLIAKNYNIETIINLTNIDYVHDKDPKQFPDAKAIKEISWKDFQKIVGDKWVPGLNVPFDPRASKLAAGLKIKVAMINGKNLDRLEDFLNNKPFIGTIIK